jgi:hypothetical protein
MESAPQVGERYPAKDQLQVRRGVDNGIQLLPCLAAAVLHGIRGTVHRHARVVSCSLAEQRMGQRHDGIHADQTNPRVWGR